MFGHLDALQLSSLNKKYQQFDQNQGNSLSPNQQAQQSQNSTQNMTPSQMLQRDIFRVDYSMVHVLMNPWRVPIKYDNEELANKLKQQQEQQKQQEQILNESNQNNDSLQDSSKNDENVNSQKETPIEPIITTSNNAKDQMSESGLVKRSFESMSQTTETDSVTPSSEEDERLNVKRMKLESDENVIHQKEQDQQKPMEIDAIPVNVKKEESIEPTIITSEMSMETNTLDTTKTDDFINEPIATEANKPEATVADETTSATIPLVVTELINDTEMRSETNLEVAIPSKMTTSSHELTQFKIPSSPLAPAPPYPSRDICVLLVVNNFKERAQFHSIVEQLGGRIVTCALVCTHLVANTIRPTENFFCAFSRAEHVLHSDWLLESERLGQFADESRFPLKDDVGEERFKVDLSRILPIRNGNLFTNIVFLLTRSCVPSPIILQRIIESNGGHAVINRPPTRQQLELMQEKEIQFIVMTCDTDLHLCHHFAENMSISMYQSTFSIYKMITNDLFLLYIQNWFPLCSCSIPYCNKDLILNHFVII